MAYAARCGCQVRVGMRQSIPSSSMDSCAGVNDTAPLSARGQTKPREGLLGKRGLRQARQAVESFAHVGHARGQPDPRSSGQSHHLSAARICTTLRNS